VDAERETASGAVSEMETISGPVQRVASTINDADNPINVMDSFSSDLKSLENFNSVVEKLATVRYHAMQYYKGEPPDPPLCASSVNRSQFCLQGSPIAHSSDDRF